MKKPPMQEMDRSEYLEERKLLIQLEAEGYRNFDKTLLTLSSGAVALSSTYFFNIPQMVYPVFLVVSWSLWCVSISSQLLSVYFTPKALREEQRVLNEQAIDPSKEPGKNRYLGKASKLNLLSTLSFALGIFSFVVFMTLNAFLK